MNDAGNAIEAIVAAGGEVDAILRAVVAELVDDGIAAWSGIFFAEGDELVLGPEAGIEAPSARAQVPVVYAGVRVAELAADNCDDRAVLKRVAALIAEYCLVGWDTGGLPWD